MIKKIGQAQAIILALLAVNAFVQQASATTMNNVFDSQPIYNAFGRDHFYKEKDKGEIRFHVSPFFQSASTVRDGNSIKVPAGDRQGPWNLFGVFFGSQAAPTALPYVPATVTYAVPPAAAGPPTLTGGNGVNYPDLFAAQKSIQTVIGDTLTTAAAPAVDRYRVGSIAAAAIAIADYTNEANFNPNVETWAYVVVPAKYEKVGARAQLVFDFGFGLGVSVKGGVVDVKQAPGTFRIESLFASNAGLVLNSVASVVPVVPPTVTLSPTPIAFSVPIYYGGDGSSTMDDLVDAPIIYDALFAPSSLTKIAKDFDLDLSTFRKTAAEDLHVELFWHLPIDCYDRHGDVGVTMIPHLAVGAWLPTGLKTDQNKPFSVPTGNEGFYGLTAEAALGFDFPILPKSEQTIQFNFGGGFLIFNDKDLYNQRFPAANLAPPTANGVITANDFQTGIIPWKIAALGKRPGLTWHMNVSAKAEEFIDGLSVYFDWIYTEHLKDRVTLKDTAARNKFFDAGLERFIRESIWKNQQINIGFNYKITDNVALGGAVQAHISGMRVYRTVTLLGGATITF